MHHFASVSGSLSEVTKLSDTFASRHYHHVPPSVSEGLFIFLQVSLSSANPLTSSYVFFIHCNVIYLRPSGSASCVLRAHFFPSNFAFRTTEALRPPEPLITRPAYANFCFTIFFSEI